MTDLEMVISQKLRSKAIEAVNSRGLDDVQLAEALELFPEGARRLRHEDQWSMNTALRVLSALGFSVSVEVGQEE